MSKYKLTQKTDANGTTQDIQLDASSVDLSGYVPTSRTINSKALSSNITLAAADVKALPNYSLSISTGSGNPREVRFVRVNYTTFDGNNAAYFRIGAMCSHGNGSSYTFLEDIIIGVSSTPSVTCTIYKQVQNASTYTIDSHSVHFGDVYWVVDTTNKYVDFYIIGGQYATINFTPFMRIGNTINDTSKIIQYTSANYYSSGTRVWDATGNGSLYARTSDISGKQDTLVSGTNIKTINNESILGSGNITISGGQATDVQINGTSITSSNVADIKTNGTYNATSNKIATMSDIPNLSGYYQKSGGALNDGAVITMTGSNPFVGLQETGGTQYYLQGYSGEIGISVGGNWGTKRLSLDANGKVFIPSKSIGDGTYTYTLPSKTGTLATTGDLSSYALSSKVIIATYLGTAGSSRTALTNFIATSSQAVIALLVPYSTNGYFTLRNSSNSVVYSSGNPILLIKNTSNVFIINYQNGTSTTSLNTPTQISGAKIYKLEA